MAKYPKDDKFHVVGKTFNTKKSIVFQKHSHMNVEDAIAVGCWSIDSKHRCCMSSNNLFREVEKQRFESVVENFGLDLWQVDRSKSNHSTNCECILVSNQEKWMKGPTTRS